MRVAGVSVAVGGRSVSRYRRLRVVMCVAASLRLSLPGLPVIAHVSLVIVRILVVRAAASRDLWI